MRFDYVRVYQQTGQTNIGCDPPDFPTEDYIQRHINAYTNYNLTVWEDADPSCVSVRSAWAISPLLI